MVILHFIMAYLIFSNPVRVGRALHTSCKSLFFFINAVTFLLCLVLEPGYAVSALLPIPINDEPVAGIYTSFKRGSLSNFLALMNNLLTSVRHVQGSDQALLIESLIFLAFLTFRTLVESTGAFYGVDLLMLVPLIGYIQWWNKENITKSMVR